jgi:hypothetical protein
LVPPQARLPRAGEGVMRHEERGRNTGLLGFDW